MKVGIDASNLRAGGGLTHLVEILRAAKPESAGFEQVVVWGGTATLAKIEPRPWLIKQHDPSLDRSLVQRAYWQRFKLGRLATQAGCDVLFAPGGSEASGFRPSVTMSRNLLPFEWKELRRFGASYITSKLLMLRLVQTRTLRKADGVIFLTEYARKAVLSSIGSLRGRLALVPHGVSRRFFVAPRLQREPDQFTAERPCRLLYVSVIDAYKHQWCVAEAVARLRSQGLHVVLDLVGPPGSSSELLAGTLRQIDPKGQFVRVQGAIPYEALHSLYANADIGVFASSCENMPNILLEEMAAGLPIACSNRGPMPAMLGDAGVYFDPERTVEIELAIRRLIESSQLRTQLAEAAFRRAGTYSWESCATDTFHFLSQVATSGASSSS